MLMRRESGSRTVQKFASQRGKQEVAKKGKSTAEVSFMAIIRLMLPLPLSAHFHQPQGDGGQRRALCRGDFSPCPPGALSITTGPARGGLPPSVCTSVFPGS